MSDPAPMSDAELAERLRATSLCVKAAQTERQRQAVTDVLMSGWDESELSALVDAIMAAIKVAR